MIYKININLMMLLILIVICQSKMYGQDYTQVLYFNKNSSVLDSANKVSIDRFVEKIKTKNISYIKIFSFTDTTGTDYNNNNLSKLQGQEVYDYLKDMIHIDTAKIYVEWLGESDEIYDLHYPKAHKQQNCIDIIAFIYKN